MPRRIRRSNGLLRGARVYLSGPMDFVASRADERRFGWRNRVGEFLASLGAVVFDPWQKPDVRGFHEYGREKVTTKLRQLWTFEDSSRGAQARAGCASRFWPSLHIDLRMVDTSDFTVAYCPTNVYSVGTPHEIITCRNQKKPVLLVSPRVAFPTYDRLRAHLHRDREGLQLLDALKMEAPIVPNENGAPSNWYMPLVDSEYFFDGFGFARYRKQFGWSRIPLDDREDAARLERPLLPFLERLSRRLPTRWDRRTRRYVKDDSWLLWDVRQRGRRGGEVNVSLPSR